MKKFVSKRTLEEIEQAANDRSLWVDKTEYDKGSDYIVIGWVSKKTGFGKLLYNTFNGTFALFDKDNKQVATHLDDKYDGEEWYDAVLSFLYKPETEE